VAQNGVTVTNLSMDAGTVTFDVSWDKNDPTMPAIWSDTVWVFVDYNDAGKMKRLLLSAGATLTATSAPGVGKVREEPGNDKGVWVVGNAKTSGAGSFSATVQLLTETASTGGSQSRPLHGACVYASNYRPVGEYISPTYISFTGTPPYDLVLNIGSGTASERVYNAYSLPAGYTVRDFTDATGAPGIIKCIVPAVQTLLVSASSFCAGSDAGVTVALSGTQAGAKYQLYRNGSPVGSELEGAGSAATFSGTFNVAGIYTARAVSTEQYCAWAMSGSHEVSGVPLAAPTVVDATFCFGLPGQLQATASGDATVAWYDAPAEGNLLYTGNVLPLTPLYSNDTKYYAQSVSAVESSCVSARTAAHYTVNNCVIIGGECPNFTAGSVGSNTRPAACSSFYSGRIGAADYPAACVSFNAGYIGRSQ
jgi:hypothetical protein